MKTESIVGLIYILLDDTACYFPPLMAMVQRSECPMHTRYQASVTSARSVRLGFFQAAFFLWVASWEICDDEVFKWPETRLACRPEGVAVEVLVSLSKAGA